MSVTNKKMHYAIGGIKANFAALQDNEIMIELHGGKFLDRKFVMQEIDTSLRNAGVVADVSSGGEPTAFASHYIVKAENRLTPELLAEKMEELQSTVGMVNTLLLDRKDAENKIEPLMGVIERFEIKRNQPLRAEERNMLKTSLVDAYLQKDQAKGMSR